MGREGESGREKEREARDLDDVAQVHRELTGRADLAAAARAVARELRDEGDYLGRRGTQNAGPRR